MSGETDIVLMDSAKAVQRLKFLRWQCHLRQIIMRENGGRPDDGIMPRVTPTDRLEQMGRIVTVLCKAAQHSKTMEFRHMVRRTNDPAQIRSAAVTFFGEAYYQNAEEFDDTLTATFRPDSPGADRLVDAGRVHLVFARFNQRFDLDCTVWRLTPTNPLFEATLWHNKLFNPGLPAGTQVLGFEPDWGLSRAG